MTQAPAAATEQSQALTGASSPEIDAMVRGSMGAPEPQAESSAEEEAPGEDAAPEAQAAGDPAEPPAEEAAFYSVEEATEFYGATIAEAAERTGLNLKEWDAVVRAGGDTSSYRATLAAELGISEGVIENYEAAFRPGAQPSSDDPAAALKALAGGDAGWQRVNDWATANLPQAEIDVINAALASEQPGVAEFAVKSLVARAQVQAQESRPVEPIGGSPPVGDVFQTEEEVMEARYAKDSRGRERYLHDARYRAAYEAKLARSKVYR
ncbi:MAG: hypothetical protein ACO3TC_07280 [Burkholderiaceae bacterium]